MTITSKPQSANWDANYDRIFRPTRSNQCLNCKWSEGVCIAVCTACADPKCKACPPEKRAICAAAPSWDALPPGFCDASQG